MCIHVCVHGMALRVELREQGLVLKRVQLHPHRNVLSFLLLVEKTGMLQTMNLPLCFLA